MASEHPAGAVTTRGLPDCARLRECSYSSFHQMPLVHQLTTYFPVGRTTGPAAQSTSAVTAYNRCRRSAAGGAHSSSTAWQLPVLNWVGRIHKATASLLWDCAAPALPGTKGSWCASPARCSPLLLRSRHATRSAQLLIQVGPAANSLYHQSHLCSQWTSLLTAVTALAGLPPLVFSCPLTMRALLP